MQHTRLDLVGLDLLDLVLEHVHRALLGRLDDDQNLLDVLVRDLAEQVVQRRLGLGKLGLALAMAALLRGFLRFLQRLDDVEPVASVGHHVDARDLHRHRGQRFLEAVAPVVGDVAHAPERAASDDERADLELAVLHEDVRHRASTFDLARLDDGAAGVTAEVGL